MAIGQAMFRDSRRRRVLQDETRRIGEYPLPPAMEGARYTEAASIENHPQVTQFIPRRYRSYALGLTLAAMAIAGIGLLHAGADSLAESLQTGPITAFDLTAGGGLAAWFGSLVLAVLATVAWLVYSLRRHRVDDYKARYRLWLWVTGGATLASINCVAQLHEVWATFMVRQTGWNAHGGAVWWLVPAALFVSWVAFRLMLETTECRGALSLVLVSAAAYATSAVALLGLLPRVGGDAAILVTSSAALVGHVTALAAAMLYARYVVLDVQGLIPHTPKGEQPLQTGGGGRESAAADDRSSRDEAVPATLPLDPKASHRGDKSPRNGARSRQTSRQEDDWVDGSNVGARHDEDHHEDDGDSPAEASRKLSKADRKRLRKDRRRSA